MNALSEFQSATPVSGRINHEPHTDHMRDPWDITDAWHEAGGDEDEEAAAYFDHNNDGEQYNPMLVGLALTEGEDTVYISQEAAWRLLGIKAVNRIERAYSERLNEGSV